MLNTKKLSQDSIDRLDGRPVVLSISGGKDSTATALLLIESCIDFKAVHMDTRWEHPDTERYVREYLPGALGHEITIIGASEGMEDLCIRKGMFPSRMRRFCTQELKLKPMRAFLRSMQDEGEDPVNAVGVRAAESRARSKLEEWEFSNYMDADVWRPIIRWTEQDVIDIHARHGVKPNPLYLRGSRRVGCWPCIFARKAEIRHMAETDSVMVDRLRALEAKVGERARERLAAKGETFESAGYGGPPAWFQAKNGGSGACWPIDRVVRWSKTTRGGRQLDMFAPQPEDSGCMRWGLCEPHR